MALWIGVDVGGTFTDLIAFDESSGEVVLGKVPTTPSAPEEGISRVVAAAIGERFTEQTTYFMHGTTIGLNALLERDGAEVGLLATAGFRDLLEIRRGDREEMFNLFWTPPPPLVPRRLRLALDERVGADGSVLRTLNSDDIARAADFFSSNGVEAIAVALINAHANPVHELAAEAALRARGFTGHVSLSHRVSGEYREYERTSTTVIDAYIRPGMADYLRRLKGRLGDCGFIGGMFVTRSGGGALTFDEAEQRPFETIHSGPVAGVMGAVELCQRIDVTDAITADVGGTSFDACFISGGRPRLRYEGRVAGFPVQAPWVDVRSVGAGGGSIIRVDGGLLRVGPESAGAHPGPASYGRGGTAPTVTDAAAVLGMLPVVELAGGVRLSRDLAEEALEPVGRELSMSTEDVARGALAIASSTMANALRQVTIEEGEDPRAAKLIAFGGAGPLFATLLARELQIRNVVVPPYAGNFSAWGLLAQDITRSRARTVTTRLHAEGLGTASVVLQSLFRDLADTRDSLESGKDAYENRVTLDVRYVGQEYTLSIPVEWVDDSIVDDASTIRDMFVQQYERSYGHTLDAALEIVSVRANVHIPLPRREFQTSTSVDSTEPLGEVHAYSFTAGKSMPFALHQRRTLRDGDSVKGPAIIIEETTTTYLDGAFELEVDSSGALFITDKGEPDGGHATPRD